MKRFRIFKGLIWIYPDSEEARASTAYLGIYDRFMNRYALFHPEYGRGLCHTYVDELNEGILDVVGLNWQEAEEIR